MRNLLRKWLGIESNSENIELIFSNILHGEARLNGFFVLKRHLQRPDKPLPLWKGKELNQD